MTNQNKLHIVYSDRFKEHDTGNHPENARRMDAVTNALREKLSQESIAWSDPRPATLEELQLVHSEEYIQSIETLAKNGGGRADPDTVVSASSYEIARLSAGAFLTAVDSVCKGKCRRAFVVSRPPGHHAFPNKAMGFCIFNNISLAARYAQKKYEIGNILILDWDVHHGNGTQHIFYEDDTVFYISTHQYPHYPGTGSSEEKGRGKGKGYTQNLPFPAVTPADKIVQAVEESLDKIVAEFKPQLFLISAGFDGHRDDYLGNWLLLEEHFAELTKMVVNHANQYASGKIISCLEGGYNLTSLAASSVYHCKELIS